MKVVKTVFKILLLPLIPVIYMALTAADFLFEIYED